MEYFVSAICFLVFAWALFYFGSLLFKPGDTIIDSLWNYWEFLITPPPAEPEPYHIEKLMKEYRKRLGEISDKYEEHEGKIDESSGLFEYLGYVPPSKNPRWYVGKGPKSPGETIDEFKRELDDMLEELKI